jgi:hypothetical protein
LSRRVRGPPASSFETRKHAVGFEPTFDGFADRRLDRLATRA